jgi:hypothetical protein
MLIACECIVCYCRGMENLTPLGQAERDVAECLLARLVILPCGSWFTGEHLLRLRKMPAIERLYFAKLTARIIDEHAMTRVTHIEPETEHVRARVVHIPPYPEPCACDAPSLRSYEYDWYRCVRCLSVWPVKSMRETTKPAIAYPLADHVEKAHIGYAMRDQL